MSGNKDKLAIILGPTACGKTAVSVRVAQLLKAEIISGDSIQVYRRMDIGTAKIRPAEMGGVPHHLIDIVEPTADYSVADFREQALSLIREINARGCLPLVVGGTGLYLSALIHPYLFPENLPRDHALRQQIQAELQEKGELQLHAELAMVDPQAAARIHPHDHHRLVRALEVYRQSGQTISALQTQSKAQPPPPYQLALSGLFLRRELLYPRIEARVEAMLNAGLADEVQALLDSGVPPTANAMQGLGYRQMVDYLQGNSTLAEATERLKRDTRRFAKRQYTWFKREPHIHWFNVEDYFITDHYPPSEKLAEDLAAWIEQAFKEVPE